MLNSFLLFLMSLNPFATEAEIQEMMDSQEQISYFTGGGGGSDPTGPGGNGSGNNGSNNK